MFCAGGTFFGIYIHVNLCGFVIVLKDPFLLSFTRISGDNNMFSNCNDFKFKNEICIQQYVFEEI